jgi:hypothetical protein
LSKQDIYWCPETYDFIVTIPEDDKIEYRIMAQDGSGTASAFLEAVKF